KDGPGAGDDDRFYEQLADDAPAAGADRTADSELMPARAATGQKKDGAVGATDDQQEDNAGKKKRQSAAGTLLERHDDGLERQMPVAGKALGMLFRKLAHYGLNCGVGGGKRDVGPEFDPRYVEPIRNVGKMLHETARQVDIAYLNHVIECETARHHANDGVRGMIDFQRSPEDVRIAAEVALPEAVVEDNNQVAAVLCIRWLDVAAEKRVHTKEASGILCDVGALNVFRQRASGDLHVREVEAERRINWGGKVQLVKLCLTNGKPASPLGVLLVNDDRVHDAVGAGVWKRVQQDGVDERKHRRGGADAERQ